VWFSIGTYKDTFLIRNVLKSSEFKQTLLSVIINSQITLIFGKLKNEFATPESWTA